MEILMNGISEEVAHNLNTLIESLHPDVQDCIDYENNVYATENRTAVLDIYRSNFLLSIEVGKSKVGYFVELNDKIYDYEDGLDLITAVKKLNLIL